MTLAEYLLQHVTWSIEVVPKLLCILGYVFAHFLGKSRLLRFDMLELFGGRGQECFGSDSRVVPGIRDPPEMFSPEKNKYHFLPKIEFQPNNGHFHNT